MPNYTTYLNLEKPLQSEQYDVDVFNSNCDKIDNFASSITIPLATTQSAGIVKPDGSTITITQDGTISGTSPLPSQTGNSGKFLTTNGTSPSWNTFPAANKDLSNLSSTGQAVIDDKVSKSGDTMSGNLTIYKQDGTTPALIGKRSDAETGTTPNEDKRLIQVTGLDKNGITVGIMQTYIGTAGQTTTNLAVKSGNNAWGNVTLSQDLSGKNTFSFPKCTTSPTTTSTASSSNVAVVVENYLNSNSWYRVWSDGFIEQGGRATLPGAASTNILTIALLKSFSTSTYSVYLTPQETGTANPAVTLYVTGRTTSQISFKQRLVDYYAPDYVIWSARGY